MRILVVEDERRVGSLVSRALKENGYEVDLVDTGEKVVELLMQNPYDGILLDVRLPGLNGIQVCRELRAARIDTPVLMLTARTLVEQRVEGLDAGADDYLTKPFAVSELLARLRAVVRRCKDYPDGSRCRVLLEDSGMIGERWIQWRIVVLFCVTAALLLGVSYAGLYVVFQRVVRGQFDRRLSEIAKPIIADLAIDPDDQDVDLLNIPD